MTGYTKIKTLVLSACIIFIPYSLLAQPSWIYHNTGINHTILVHYSANISVNGSSVVSGDYLGIFFNTPSGLSCGGYGQFTGSTITIAAWGTEPGLNNGFAPGETFKWKIWTASDEQEYNAVAVYNTIAFPDSGKFVTNGLSGLTSLTAQVTAVPPQWTYTNTGNYHLIVIPDTTEITINGLPVLSGDYIGVFYDSAGTTACGGYLIWDNTFQFLNAFGKSMTVDNGFETGEAFTWKIWRTYDGVEVIAIPQYDTFNYNDSGNYFSTGISGIISLSALTGPDLSIIAWNYPASGCQTLTDSEHVSVRIKNIGSTIVNTFSVKCTVNGFQLLSQNVSQTIPVGSSIDFVFDDPLDFAVIDTFDCIVEVIFPSDVNNANNTYVKQLINFPVPSVYISGLQSQYCTANTPVTMSGFPAGGYFYGGGVVNNLFYHSIAGNYSVSYAYTDTLAGCSNIVSESVVVVQSPVIDLGPDQVDCFGEIITLEVDTGYQSYYWAGGGTDYYYNATATGYYSVTVTNASGCKGVDVVHLTFNPIPSVQISGNLTGCYGDTIVLDAGIGYDLYIWNDSAAYLTQTHVVTQSGYYKVIVFLDNCIAADSVFVEFFPLPVVEIIGEDSACTGEKITLQATQDFEFYFWSNSVDIFSSTTEVILSGIYSVTVSNIYGCYGSDEFSISFFPFPVADFSVIPFLCAGDTMELDPGKADEYLWSDGSTNSGLLVTASGNYSVALTTNGCTKSDSVNVNFYDKPDAEFGYDQVVNEVYFINYSSISESYSWDFGDNTVSSGFEPFHIYSSPGIYFVVLTLQNDCGIEQFADTVVVTDILTQYTVSSSGIVPNPNLGNFYFDIIIAEPVIAEVSITNIKGQPVILFFQRQLLRGENKIYFDLRTQPDGIYFLKLSFEKGEIFHQLIKTYSR